MGSLGKPLGALEFGVREVGVREVGVREVGVREVRFFARSEVENIANIAPTVTRARIRSAFA